MAEFNKFDSFIADLNSIETQISVLSSMYKDVSERNRELEDLVKELRNENDNLLQKISKLEKEKNLDPANVEIFSTLSTKEREELKARLQSFLNKIEFHLSS